MKIFSASRNIFHWFIFSLFKGNGQPVYNIYIGNRDRKKLTKWALVSYITVPFRLKKINPQKTPFTNIGIVQSLIKVLNNLGYLVDVVEYTDTKFLPTKDYDLFIGHGGFNFQHLARNLKNKAIKIYFSAGPYWKFWNRQEKMRIDALRKRKNINYPYERLDVSEEWACRHADFIIALGNKIVEKSYQEFPKVKVLNNAAFADDYYEKKKKDWKNARKNFLFFAGGGNVHKGLDLLLESFIHLGAHLYICQLLNPLFYKIYRHELEDFSNIHLIGWTTLRSPKYYEIVDKCAFMIYPSCADGSPGAVVEAMHQGLIPILSKEASIDTEDFGYTLKKCTVWEIKRTVDKLVKYSPSQCQELSLKVRTIAKEKYSEKAFLKNMESVIKGALEGKI